jgi:hypothetical protein
VAPFKLLSRRVGPLGLALTVYDLYRRLPPKQRKQVRELARKHGPTAAAKAVKLYSHARDLRRR